jgi:hypothetical protein
VWRDEEWRPDRAERAQRGYGLRDAATAESGSAADRYVSHLPPARQKSFQLAMFGDPTRRSAISFRSGRQFSFPTDGCIADSQSRIYGSPDAAARVRYVPQDLFVTAYLAMRAGPEYSAVVAAWRDCMGRKGMHYDSPADAKQRLINEYRPGAAKDAFRREVRVALADADCAERTGLPAAVVGLLRQQVERLPAAELDELARVATDRTTAVLQARALSETALRAS